MRTILKLFLPRLLGRIEIVGKKVVLNWEASFLGSIVFFFRGEDDTILLMFRFIFMFMERLFGGISALEEEFSTCKVNFQSENGDVFRSPCWENHDLPWKGTDPFFSQNEHFPKRAVQKTSLFPQMSDKISAKPAVTTAAPAAEHGPSFSVGNPWTGPGGL